MRAATPDLAEVVAAFGQALHNSGVPATPERVSRFARAVTLAPPVSNEELYWAGRVTLLTARQQIPVYDAVFGRLFGDASPVGDRRGEPEGPTSVEDRAGEGGGSVFDTSQPSESEATDPSGDPSALAAEGGGNLVGSSSGLRHKAFADCTPEELAALRALIAELQVAPPTRASRRERRHSQGRRLDLRATLRRSQRTAGDPVDVVVRRQRTRPRRLVLIADVSGSMEPYSRTLLHLLHSAVRAARAETFVFSTRLTRITRALNDTNPDVALRRASREATDWSGGTLIGEALADFNNRWGRRGIARGSVVVIVSDGCDFGDPVIVVREMERLSRLAHRIIWVNPRAARSDYRARFRGMIAALPYIDALLSGHSLDTLDELIHAISSEEPFGAGLAGRPEPQAVPPPRKAHTHYLFGSHKAAHP